MSRTCEDDIAQAVADRVLRSAEAEKGFDVANSLHMDPHRPPPIVLQEFDDHHDTVAALTGPMGRADLPLGSLPGVIEEDRRQSVHDQMLDLERSRELAKDALARMDAHLPTSAAERKGIPLFSGCINYFPDALAAVAILSRIGNDQHNPGSPLHWDRSKSGDEKDALARHLLEAGTFDTDGVRHSAKVAWRALANLQKEIEEAKARLEPVFR